MQKTEFAIFKALVDDDFSKQNDGTQPRVSKILVTLLGNPLVVPNK